MTKSPMLMVCHDTTINKLLDSSQDGANILIYSHTTTIRPMPLDSIILRKTLTPRHCHSIPLHPPSETRSGITRLPRHRTRQAVPCLITPRAKVASGSRRPLCTMVSRPTLSTLGHTLLPVNRMIYQPRGRELSGTIIRSTPTSDIRKIRARPSAPYLHRSSARVPCSSPPRASAISYEKAVDRRLPPARPNAHTIGQVMRLTIGPGLCNEHCSLSRPCRLLLCLGHQSDRFRVHPESEISNRGMFQVRRHSRPIRLIERAPSTKLSGTTSTHRIDWLSENVKLLS